MTIRLSEIQITKVSDVSSTPLLFSGDAFDFDGINAGGGVRSDEGPEERSTCETGKLPYMEIKLKEVLISGVMPNGGDTAVDPNNPNVDPSDPSIGLFSTETVFPTETVHPTASLDDGGFVIYGFPTETIPPIESVHHFELLI